VTVFRWFTVNPKTIRPGNLGAVDSILDYPKPPYLRDSRVLAYPELSRLTGQPTPVGAFPR